MLSVVCMLCVGLSASADNNRLDFSDLSYAFDYSKDKCTALNFEAKKYIFAEYNKGNFIVTNKINGVAGNIVITITEVDGQERSLVSASSYGACRFFEDFIVRGKDVDPKNYINLKEKK